MDREKQIQIPEALFKSMAIYILDEESRTSEKLREIKNGIRAKLDRQIDHELYTKYKRHPNEEEREKARQEYLNRRAISPKFRW